MLYREYGKTGKKVSVIGYGGMRFRQEDYKDGNLEKCAKIVRRASELGVNYFDTAPDYCGEKSEFIYGEAFKNMPNPFYVSTKCGLWNANDADGMRRVLETSLERLGLDKIHFYNMWCIKTLDEYKEFMKKGGVYEGALKAKQEGLIDHICFTTHMNGSDIAKVAGFGNFEGVTLGFNAVNFKFRMEGVKACADNHMGVVTMNPLGGGIIPSHPEFFSFLKGNSKETSLVVAALRFILSLKEITCAIPGGESIEQVEENVKAANDIVLASGDILESIGSNLYEELNSLCTGCQYCDECPADVPIPKLMEAFNEYILDSGNTQAIKNRLAWHWDIQPSAAEACAECGKCETLCTQKLPIMERLKIIAQIDN